MNNLASYTIYKSNKANRNDFTNCDKQRFTSHNKNYLISLIRNLRYISTSQTLGEYIFRDKDNNFVIFHTLAWFIAEQKTGLELLK